MQDQQQCASLNRACRWLVVVAWIKLAFPRSHLIPHKSLPFAVNSTKRGLILTFLILVLLVLHQDYWQWDRADIVLGFLPYTLAYHAAISLAAVFVWILAVVFCWPSDLADDALDVKGDDGT